jgi:hypothetical protein
MDGKFMLHPGYVQGQGPDDIPKRLIDWEISY